MEEELMTKKNREKKVVEEGTPKAKYFEPTLIASNKPTPNHRKRANASHRKHNKNAFHQKNIESNVDNVSSMELGEVNMDDVRKESEKETYRGGNVEADVDMDRTETFGVENPFVVEDNMVDNSEALLKQKEKDDVHGEREDEKEEERVSEDDVRIDEDGDMLEEDGGRVGEYWTDQFGGFHEKNRNSQIETRRHSRKSKDDRFKNAGESARSY